MNTPADPATTLSGVLVVVLNQLQRQHQSWAWLRMAQGPGALRGTPGLRFGKVMGSGAGGGFGLRPSPSHQSLLAVFEHIDQAHAFVKGPLVQAYRERSADHWCGVLQVVSARGQWDAMAWAPTEAAQMGNFAASPPDSDSDSAPLAALTRASIRPAKAMAFWRNAPATQAAMRQAAGCRLAIGLGEVPLIRQCTLSLWDNTASMLAYAQQGAHLQAAQAAYRHQFFSESLFVRLRLLAQQGHWPPPDRTASATGEEPNG